MTEKVLPLWQNRCYRQVSLQYWFCRVDLQWGATQRPPCSSSRERPASGERLPPSVHFCWTSPSPSPRFPFGASAAGAAEGRPAFRPTRSRENLRSRRTWGSPWECLNRHRLVSPPNLQRIRTKYTSWRNEWQAWPVASNFLHLLPRLCLPTLPLKIHLPCPLYSIPWPPLSLPVS